MGKIPIPYKAYDNGYKIPMGICLGIGVSAIFSGLFGEEPEVLVFGIICIVLFFFFKYLNYSTAKKEAEENTNAKIEHFKKEVNVVLNDAKLNNQEKILKIIDLAENGNVYAVFLLKELENKIP